MFFLMFFPGVTLEDELVCVMHKSVEDGVVQGGGSEAEPTEIRT
jgi:hypothetical protein